MAGERKEWDTTASVCLAACHLHRVAGPLSQLVPHGIWKITQA
jgi:hypothetical protein